MNANNLLIGVIVITLAIIFLPVCSLGEPMTVNEVYHKIKQLEDIFPLPVPETIKIGTYDAKTRRFTGNISFVDKSLESIKDLPGGKVPPPWWEGDYRLEWIEEKPRFVRFQRIYSPTIRSPLAVLQFGIVNANVPITVGAHGKSASGTGTILLGVGCATKVNWHIRGKRVVESYLLIRRQAPPNIAFGAFTIPALPISVIYEPPPDKMKKSSAKYQSTKYIGTTTEVSFGTEESTTSTVKPQGYRKTDPMKSALGTAATVLSTAARLIPIPYADKAISALSSIADGLGKITATETKGYAEAQGTSLTLRYSQSEKFDTSPNDGGPGIGDIIVYQKNVKFLWFVNGDRLELTMLGCDDNMPKLIGVDFLQKNLGNKEKTGLDYQVGKALLDLDPFLVTKTIATLTDRYEWVGEVDMRYTGSEYSIGFEKEFSQTDWRSNREFTTRVEDYRKGWLSFLGIGVTADETVKFTSWNENMSKTTLGKKTGVNLVFRCSIDEIYITDIYYDRIFGTFAFESVPPAQTAMLSGTATGPDGKPVSGKMITLMIGGKPITTVTNKEGRFEFYSSRIKGGKGSLVVDNKVSQEISLSPGRPVSGIKL